MFERLTDRGEKAAERRARARTDALAEQMKAEAPPGVTITLAARGVLLSGRALRRRFALEPALRWLTAALR
jgi:hypothetical protein